MVPFFNSIVTEACDSFIKNLTNCISLSTRTKRKKKEAVLEDEKPAKKAKKQKKSPVGKKKNVDDSGSEYSDLEEDKTNGAANGTKRSYSDDSDGEEVSKEPKRRRFSLAKDEDVSDGDF